MKKKSGKKAAAAFKRSLREVQAFLEALRNAGVADAYLTWAHDYAIVKIYREFENMILNCLIAAINNDTTQLSTATGTVFPKHLTDEVCEYIVTGGGYVDFRGRDDLIRVLKKFLPDGHYLVTTVKKGAHKDILNRLVALRNFAAHGSKPSKKRALEAIGTLKLSSSGAWLKKQDRIGSLMSALENLANEIFEQAPH